MYNRCNHERNDLEYADIHAGSMDMAFTIAEERVFSLQRHA